MIEYNSKSALLEIPKGLGNFAENGSGGGQDIGPLSGSVVELSATTVGIETNLGNLSGSTETLQQDLGELSGTTDSIGDAVADLLLDVDDLDTRVSGNTEDIEALSGVTSGISQNVEALSGVTSGLSGNIMELSGVTSGLAVDIETLSGVTSAIISGESVVYFDLINDYGTGTTEAQRLYNNINGALNAGLVPVVVSAFNSNPNNPFGAVARKDAGNNHIYIKGIGENYSGSTFCVSRTALFIKPSGEVGNAVEINGHYYFKSIGNISQYSLPTASVITKGGVKVGSGLTINSEKLSVNIGEGLAYSGNTIVVSGGTGGGPAVYVLNLMSQAERLALYNELVPYREGYMGVSSGFPAQDYAFYYWAGDETSEGWNDGARGFVPMQLTAMHPDDYGGACFFTGTVKSRNGNNEILWVRYVITSAGEADKSTGINSWDSPAGYFYIYSDGTVPQDTDRYSIQGKDVIMIRCGDWNRGWVESLSFTNDYSVLHIKGKIQIDGVEYAGYWTWTDGQAEPWRKVSFTAV